jgi:hypothetical protein
MNLTGLELIEQPKLVNHDYEKLEDAQDIAALSNAALSDDSSEISSSSEDSELPPIPDKPKKVDKTRSLKRLAFAVGSTLMVYQVSTEAVLRSQALIKFKDMNYDFYSQLPQWLNIPVSIWL